MEKLLVFNDSDFKEFIQWIQFDREGLTWQGRYETDFQDFLDIFFIEGLSLKQIMQRFFFAEKEVNVGPLIAWFKWVREKIICYCFTKKGLSVSELANETGIDVKEVAIILRNFLCEIFPHLSSRFDERLEMNHATSENRKLKFHDLEIEYLIENDFVGSSSDEIMTSLEVTLYPEWKKLISKMQQKFIHRNMNIQKMEEKASFKTQFRIFQEILLLFLVTGLLIFLVRAGNKWYENYLTEKIKIAEPEFLWLDKNLSFKDKDSQQTNEEVELITSEINRIQSIIDSQDDQLIEREERFEDESDVVLTSVDDLPKQFEAADVEQSEYEEERKGYGYNFRDYRFGSKVVYRIMLKSTDSNTTKKELDSLLKKYGAERADSVEPGKNVPGGFYYNLYLPRSKAPDFIKEALKNPLSNLYKTKTKGHIPYGKSKVFIWIKEI